MEKTFCVSVEKTRKSMYGLKLVIQDLMVIGDKVNVLHVYDPSEKNINEFRIEIESHLLIRVREK